MKQPAQKFMFNHNLRPDVSSVGLAEAPTEQVDQSAISRAYNEGLSAGRAAAEAEHAAILAQANSMIATQLSELNQRMTHDIQAIEARASQIALHFAQKLTSNMIDREPTALIQAAFIKCLSLAGQTPSLTIHSAELIVDELKALLSQKALDQGYRGEIIVLGNPTLAGSSVMIEWSDGGLTFDPEKVRSEVETLALTYFQPASHASEDEHS